MRVQQIHINTSTLKVGGMERELEGVFKNTGPHLPACTCMTCHGKTPAPAFPCRSARHSNLRYLTASALTTSKRIETRLGAKPHFNYSSSDNLQHHSETEHGRTKTTDDNTGCFPIQTSGTDRTSPGAPLTSVQAHPLNHAHPAANHPHLSPPDFHSQAAPPTGPVDPTAAAARARGLQRER